MRPSPGLISCMIAMLLSVVSELREARAADFTLSIADGASGLINSNTEIGRLFIQPLGTLDITGSYTLTIGIHGRAEGMQGDGAGVAAGVIRSTGNLAKNGNGTLLLSGVNTYSGDTTVEAGTLAVDGVVKAGSNLTVRSGATLKGTGSVGNVDVQHGGTISPGHSIGTLTIVGNYLQKGSYAVEYRAPLPGVAPVAGTDNDYLHVTGAATLTGGTVAVSPQSTAAAYDAALRAASNPTPGKVRWMILRADGGLGGTQYAALSGAPDLVRLEFPNSTDVDLVLTGSVMPPEPPILIVSDPPAGTLKSASRLWQGAVEMARLRPRCYDPDFGRTGARGFCGFVEGELNLLNLGAAGMLRTGTGMAGIGRRVHPGLKLGVAFAYGFWSERGDGSDFARTMAMLWGEWRPVNVDLRWWLAGGYTDVDVHRRTTLDATARSSYRASQAMGALEWRRWMKLSDSCELSPLVGVQCTTLFQGAYRETGGGIENFRSDSQRMVSVQSDIGAELQLKTGTGKLPLVIDLLAAWSHEYGDASASVSGRYESDAARTLFTRNGVGVGREQLHVGASVLLPAGNGTLRIGYNGAYAGHLASHTIMARYTIGF